MPMQTPYQDKNSLKMTSPRIYYIEQNQASEEGAILSGGGCGVHPHNKREEDTSLTSYMHYYVLCLCVTVYCVQCS